MSGQSSTVLGIAAGVTAAAAVGFIVVSRGERGARREEVAPRPVRAARPDRAERSEPEPIPREAPPAPVEREPFAEPVPAPELPKPAAPTQPKPPAGRKLILQGHAAVADTWLTPDHPDAAKGSVTHANIQVNTPDRTLVRFEIPSEVVGVKSAALMLYIDWVDERGGFEVSVHRVRTPWKAETATYAKPWKARGLSAGADHDSTPAASAKAPVPPRWVEFDVTHVVRAWVSGEPNCGFLIRAAPWVRTGGRYRLRMTDADRDGPKLVIETE